MERTTLPRSGPGFDEALPKLQSLIRAGEIAKAVKVLVRGTSMTESAARSEIELEREFLDTIARSHDVDRDRSATEVSARAALILAAVVGWKGDEPSSWSRPVDRETLLAWAASHYTGPADNLDIALEALVLQGLFFDVHPAVFSSVCYYCTFDTDFLDEISPGRVPVGMWKDYCDTYGCQSGLARHLWTEFRQRYDNEYGFTWLNTGLCWGQGSESGGSPWGPCVGSSCVWYRTGVESCTQKLRFNLELRPPTAPNLQTVFISYGGPDKPFATRLHRSLERHGIRTWFFPRDAIPGQKLHTAMREGVGNHDRVVAICSRHSLERHGFLNELEQTLAREAREGGSAVLLPVAMDDFVFTDWKPSDSGRMQEILDRVVADFRGTANDATLFDAAVSRLARALRRK